jgi:hypothetical protein
MPETEKELLPEPIEVTDQELFDSAVADKPPGDEAKPDGKEPEVTQDDRPRDEQGRFIAKEGETETKPDDPAKPAEPVAADDQDRQGQIPSWRLREEREAKAEAVKALEAERQQRARYESEMLDMRRQLAALQKPPEVKPEDEPDPLLDPRGFRDHLERKFGERLLNQQREMDLRMAHRLHGKLFEDAYAEAERALASGDQHLRMLMNNTSSAGDTLMGWYQQRQTLREVGNDPAAYKTKLLEEALKDPAYLAKAVEAARTKAGGSGTRSSNNGSRPAVELPPSISSAARADTVTSGDLDVSDEALFNYATRK